MGTSSLSTLLATRLDAVLGTTLAQHPVLLEGMKPHNVAQAASALHPQDSVIRRGGAPVDEAGARRGQAGAAGVGRGTAAGTSGLPGAKGDLPGGIQPSARAVLSEPARTILALLVSQHGSQPALRGRVPLWLSATPTQAASRATPGTAATAPANPSSQPAAGTQAEAGARASAMQTLLPRGPEGMVRALTQSLGQTVSTSGLFYESHLSQMVFGQRSMAEVLKEPQALLGRAAGAQSQPSASGAAAASLAASPAWAAGVSATAPEPSGFMPAGSADSSATSSTAGNASTSTGIGAAQSQSPPIPGIHPDAAPLVRQQLETLANAAVHWQGEAWPGTPMEWEVSEDSTHREHDAPATWATRLNLQLPSLGNVEARISLAGDQLVVRLVAPDSAPLLQEFSPALRESLHAGGLTLSDLSVLSTPHTDDDVEAGVAAAPQDNPDPGPTT